MRNIAYKLPSIDSWSVEQVYQRFGQPSKQTVARVDGKPIGPEAPPYAVRPAVTLRAVDPSAAEISIIDFGEASFSSTPRTTWHTPLLLQAPEALLGESVGQPADMWAFACTVFALFGNSVPFECGMPDSDDVLAEIVDGLGPLPQRWWDKWELRPEFYDYSGAKKTDLLPKEYWPVKPLAERIRQIRSSPPAARDAEQLGAEDVLGLRTLLESCLRYDPAERATAEDVLELAWIQKLRKAYASTNDHA